MLTSGSTISLWGQVLEASLSPSIYNGYNISCFGKKDGALDATVAGGTPPYTYQWSTGDVTEDLSGLPSGYYELTVADAVGDKVQVAYTLTEPEDMKVELDPFKYPSGHNVSCYECYNGSIDVTVSYGVPPYTYPMIGAMRSSRRTVQDLVRWCIRCV
ncbi:MAG: SprB repeat-containing protein [Flavobacteriales bacterium]|nr:SprB repeat-containing protein [Flavobacteriales bacterium]